MTMSAVAIDPPYRINIAETFQRILSRRNTPNQSTLFLVDSSSPTFELISENKVISSDQTTITISQDNEFQTSFDEFDFYDPPQIQPFVKETRYIKVKINKVEHLKISI